MMRAIGPIERNHALARRPDQRVPHGCPTKLEASLTQLQASLMQRKLEVSPKHPAHLLEHRLEEHIQPRVPLHLLLELDQHRVERLWVALHVVHRHGEEAVVVSLVLGHPVALLRPSVSEGDHHPTKTEGE